MKSIKLTWVPTLTLLAVLALPVRLSAQDNRDHHHKHRHYKVIDLGTFGGPTGYLCNDPSGGGGACGVLNNWGSVVSAADTSTPDPNYPNGNPFLPSDPFSFHAFQWRDGTLQDLGALPGGYNSFANGISGNGLIVGASENGTIDPLLGVPELRAVMWKDGKTINLGTLEGGSESFAVAVNKHGQVAGLALNTIPDPFFGFQLRAALWQNGTVQDLGTLGSGTDAFALFVNESGQIAGYSFTNTTVNPVTGLPTQDPFLWQNGTMKDLGTLGGTLGLPNDLNNRGQVVGQSDLAGDINAHAFLWDKGVLTDLGTLVGASPPNSTALWINDAGEIVGKSNTQNGFEHAVLWKNAVITDLGTLGGDPCTIGLGINSRGDVVGASSDCAVNHDAFLWENGRMINLNTFNPRGSSLQRLTLAFNINDHGEIAGLGIPPGVDPKDVFTLGHAFVLIPCDEKHGDSEGCVEGGGENAVSANEPAPREVPKRTLTAPRMQQRLWAQPFPVRQPAQDIRLSCTQNNGGANYITDNIITDDLGGCTSPDGNGGRSHLTGRCAIATDGRLLGYCVGTNFGHCSSAKDPANCPPGVRSLHRARFLCGFNYVYVDAKRTCNP